MILNRAKDYYKDDKERLRQQTRNKYRNLSEEEKVKKENMGRMDIAISNEKKQRLTEYQKTYRETKKSQYNNK